MQNLLDAYLLSDFVIAPLTKRIVRARCTRLLSRSASARNTRHGCASTRAARARRRFVLEQAFDPHAQATSEVNAGGCHRGDLRNTQRNRRAATLQQPTSQADSGPCANRHPCDRRADRKSQPLVKLRGISIEAHPHCPEQCSDMSAPLQDDILQSCKPNTEGFIRCCSQGEAQGDTLLVYRRRVH